MSQEVPRCTAVAEPGGEQCLRPQHRSLGGWHRSERFTWPSEQWKLTGLVATAPRQWRYEEAETGDVRLLHIDDFSRPTVRVLDFPVKIFRLRAFYRQGVLGRYHIRQRDTEVAWCGTLLYNRGRNTTADGQQVEWDAEAICPRCLSAARHNRPKAYRSR